MPSMPPRASCTPQHTRSRRRGRRPRDVQPHDSPAPHTQKRHRACLRHTEHYRTGSPSKSRSSCRYKCPQPSEFHRLPYALIPWMPTGHDSDGQQMDRGLQKAAANLLESTLTRLLRLNSQEMKSAKQLPQQKLPQQATELRAASSTGAHSCHA